MKKIRIVFFDVKHYEKEYIVNNIPEEYDYTLIAEPFHQAFAKEPEKFSDVEVISIFTDSRVNAANMAKMPELKLIACRSTGFSHVDNDYCKKNNIAIENVPRYGDATVAEFAFALLLDVTRKVREAYTDLKNGEVQAHKYIGMDLQDKTIGIIGTGAIGANAIRIAKGFNMNVIAYDLYPKAELATKYDFKYVSLDELLENSDIISVHAPSTKENFHMLSTNEFEKMKKGVVIINTARGELVDTVALYNALQDEKVAAAGLDVLECEEIISNQNSYLSKIDCVNQECLARTLINHRLLSMPNVVVTPHVAFDTKEAIHRILETTITNLKSYSEGTFVNKVCC